MCVWAQGVTANRRPHPGLLHQVSRAVFWNTALLPLVSLAGIAALGSGTAQLWTRVGLLRRRPWRSQLHPLLYEPRPLGQPSQVYSRAAVDRRQKCCGAIDRAPRIDPPRRCRSGRARPHVLAGPDRSGTRSRTGRSVVPARARCAADRSCRARLRLSRARFCSFNRSASTCSRSSMESWISCLAAVAIGLGLQMTGVIGALGVSAIVIAIAASVAVIRHLRPHPDGSRRRPAARTLWDRASGSSQPSRIVRDLSLYFATPAFASPVLLKTLGGPEPVALFATSYFVASSTVTLVVSGFRGIYRPAFARVMAGGERAAASSRIRSDQQGAGAGGRPGRCGTGGHGGRLPAAALWAALLGSHAGRARALVFLFAETALAVGPLVLWVDERYRAVLATQAVMIAGAPLFIWTAGGSACYRHHSCWAGAVLRPRSLATPKHGASTVFDFHGDLPRRSDLCRC